MGYAVYVWKFKPLILRLLPISHNQDQHTMYVSSQSPYLFWPATYSSMGSNNSGDGYCECSTRMFSIPVRITGLQCRGEWHSRATRWFNMTINSYSCEFVFCDSLKLINNVFGFVRQCHKRRNWLDEGGRRRTTGWWAYYTPSWCRLDWNIMQVIIIARLYAMYQRSRKMLIFLIVVFLAIRITNAVIVAIMMTQVSGGKL
jgi:hypothetical protein